MTNLDISLNFPIRFINECFCLLHLKLFKYNDELSDCCPSEWYTIGGGVCTLALPMARAEN